MEKETMEMIINNMVDAIASLSSDIVRIPYMSELETLVDHINENIYYKTVDMKNFVEGGASVAAIQERMIGMAKEHIASMTESLKLFKGMQANVN